MASERENWITSNYPDDNMVGFASNEDLSYLVNQVDSGFNPDLLFKRFSTKLILENVPRLTKEYNTRFLPILKKYYGEFYEGLVSSGSVFGKKAVLPCYMRDCDDDEFMESISHLFYLEKPGRIEQYKNVRAKMRKKHMTFDPVTPELIMLLADEGTHPSINEPFLSLSIQPTITYGDGNYSFINRILRSEKDSTSGKSAEEIVRIMSIAFSGLAFPFTTDNELVVWRADNIDVATDEFFVGGYLSTSLVRSYTSGYGDKRGLKINMPRGTPFLSVLSHKTIHAEIALLPGTKLTLVREQSFADGTLFAEYDVTANPEPFEDKELATILRAALSQYIFDPRLTVDVPSNEEKLKFIYNLINKRYGGDF